ncbi:MAG: hypothetical protein KDC48_19125, partial [Planctomycetes bacterium]|nr:hypothetical protein [Planctomycetota bacterium]
YIVRRRHAHSWVIAWLDGAWREIDTTPALWVANEQAEASWWEPAYDWLSWLWFQYSRWRWQVETEEEGNDVLWLVLPLSLFLAWRLRRSRRVDQRRPAGAAPRPPSPGTDSELYLVERRLRAEGITRGEGEPIAPWLARLAEEGRLADAELLLGEVVRLHYRYRFDPQGIAPADRERLRDGVRDWLARHAGGGGAKPA